MAIHIHFYDAFSEEQHPRGQPSNAGEFVKKGSSTAAQSKTTKPKRNQPPTQVRAKLAKHTPPRPPDVDKAIKEYKSSDYRIINDCARFEENCGDTRVDKIQKYLTSAKLPAANLYRTIRMERHSAKYIDELKGLIQKHGEGVRIKDNGFVSTTTSEQFADTWRGGPEGGLLLEIQAPDDFHGAVVRPDFRDDENEVLIPRGSQFVVKSFNPKTWKVVVALDQSEIIK